MKAIYKRLKPLKSLFKSKNHRVKVHFLVCGVQKSGTTSFDYYLRQHPQICMPSNLKEVHFFDRDRLFKYWSDKLIYPFYHSNFDPQKHHKIIGEVTPIYSYWNPTMSRIWKYNSKMKIILILRNPIRRAFSHWQMSKKSGHEKHSFYEAITQETLRARSRLPRQSIKNSYIDRGLYVEQIRKIKRFFPNEQILFIKSEDLKEDTEATLTELAQFLDVKPFPKLNKVELNQNSNKLELDIPSQKILLDKFYFEIKEIEKELNWDLSDWLQ